LVNAAEEGTAVQVATRVEDQTWCWIRSIRWPTSENMQGREYSTDIHFENRATAVHVIEAGGVAAFAGGTVEVARLVLG
jgi:hypothetical protein